MIMGVIAIVGLGMTLRSFDMKDCGTVISCDNGYEQRYDLLVRAYNVAIQYVELNGMVMPARAKKATTRLKDTTNTYPFADGVWLREWG
jgi:hypothetical protein